MTRERVSHFWLKLDTDTFHSLAFEHESDGDAYSLIESTAVHIDWTPREVSPIDADEENAIFGDFISLNWRTVLSLTAVDALEEVLRRHGELLPLVGQSEQLFAYRVTSVLDAFDFEASTFDTFASSSRIKFVRKFVLRTDVDPTVEIFRVKSLEWVGVVVSSAFVLRVEEHGLRGCVFVPLNDGPES
jgi:hypothetical protein